MSAMEKRTFTIEGSNLNFRTNFKSPIEILSLQLTLGFDDIDKLSSTLGWLYERVEVYLENMWLPLKEKGVDVFNPVTITLAELQKVAFYMLNFVKEVFHESNE